jgi:hypothetical protein
VAISRGRQVRRNWIPITLSAAMHLLLLIAAVELTRQTAERDPADRAAEPADRARSVEMIYIPPPKVSPPPAVAPNRPPPPPPVKRQPAPEPEPNAPPEATRSRGSETESPNPPAGERGPTPPAPQPAAPAEEATATLESEARRIFGRPRLTTPPGAGPQARRPMEAYADNAERCTPRPAPPSDSAGQTQFGVVTGKIFRQDNGRPLAGANLQMLGAPYVAFTDANGEYRFRFDMALVDNCRTQYVRVTAAGYESRLLVLVVGPNAQSEDVRLRHQ